ncbi:ABC transporter ATP-binding protein [Albidovulum sp.]|uniref:ABC transporter ATP-binding protein n=1 Tax=Albidovulum sp. TaxID=1872424 RepID=UPI0039B877EF
MIQRQLSPEVPASRPAIELDAVRKIYGRGASAVEALRGISFDIRDNEFFTLLGPSGCGKTTLLRALAGFEHISGGTIRLFGQDIADMPAHKRPVNTVFQHYALFPHMTIAENVGYGLKRLRKPDDEIRAKVAEMLRLVKMERFADRLPAQLSGGQQQRVALARALAPHPKVLLLDEPLSALDLKLRQAMRQELKQIQAKTGITFIFVTHDQDEALSMSDRIAVMSEGQVQQVGTPSEIYEHPANRFVAGFVGDANFIGGRITGRAGNEVDCQTDGGLVLRADGTRAPQAEGATTLFLRPEKIRLVRPGTGTVDGRIETIQYLGDACLMDINIGETSPLLVSERMADIDQPRRAAGDVTGVVLDARSVQVLEG